MGLLVVVQLLLLCGTASPSHGENAGGSGVPMEDDTMFDDEDFQVQSGSRQGIGLLPYIQLGNTTGVTRNSVRGDDTCSNVINIPVKFQFGNLEHTTAYVCTNGLISFGNPRTNYISTLFTSISNVHPVVAPFWADINVNAGGNIWYEVHTDSTSAALLTQVNEFIHTQQQNNFTGTWMLVAEWNNVPEFGSRSPLNTFQGLVITDGLQAYTVFIYQCGDINWGRRATIGFKADAHFFFNHPNSRNNATSIDCQSSATGNTVIYHIGSALITCYTTPSNSGEFNCNGDSFSAASVEECCMNPRGYFFQRTGIASCTPCTVFGWFNGTELPLQEQDESQTLTIGFIKGGNVQNLTSSNNRDTASFQIAVGGNATLGANADFTIQTTLFEVVGSNDTEPFSLSTFVRIDHVALETTEDFTLSLIGVNNAGRNILDPEIPGHFVNPMIRVVIEDTECAELQFTEPDYSNEESVGFIRPVVQLITNIATDLTVEIIPLNYTDVLSRSLGLSLDFPASDPKRPNIATSIADFSTNRQTVTFVAGDTATKTVDIGLIDDDINEVEQYFVILLEVVSAIDPDRVNLQGTRNASLGRILDNDPINIGFKQQRYTVFEADVASGHMMQIPIFKDNNKQSEITLDVFARLITGSNSTAAVRGRNEDFRANSLQRHEFNSSEQFINYEFELLDDEIPEPEEYFEIELSIPDLAGLTGINLGANGSNLFARATIVIIDNDDVIIGWEQNITAVNETHGSLELCISIISINKPQEIQLARVSLAVNTVRGTAADSSDYHALRDNSVVFAFKMEKECINVEIIDDDVLEKVEYFSLQVILDQFQSDLLPNVKLEPNVTFVEILDDDFVRVGFNQTEYTVIEGIHDVIVYVAVLEGDLRRSVSVNISTHVLGSDTATAGDDFILLTKQLILDETTTVIPVEIAISDDDVFEKSLETFTVSLIHYSDVNEVVISPNASTVFISDVGLALNFSSSIYTVRENETHVSVQLLLNFDEGFNLNQSVEVEFITLEDAAQAGEDFNGMFTNITINTTITSILIPILEDGVVEANESFTCRITLVSTTTNVLITQAEAVVMIVDNDNLTIQFEEPMYSVMEGAELSLRVRIFGRNEIPLALFFTINGSATFQEDFNLPQFEPEQNLSIAIDPTHPIDNTTTRYLQLNLSTIDDDIAVEGTESIIVELSSFSDKVRQGEYFTTTIHIANNDEIRVGFADAHCEGAENESISISVMRSGARIASILTLNVTIELNEMNLTGVCGPQPSDSADFDDLEITVTFDHNDKSEDIANFVLPIADDEINESEEFIILALQLAANHTGDIILQNHMMSCTLKDDDEISIMFEEETYTFQESESSPAISLIADRPSQQEFVLTIEAEDGGVSMSKLNITNAEFIPFKPELRNNNSMVINIAITNDDVAESNRSQLLKLRRRLQSPSFANCVGFLQTCSNTAIHISDDDRVIIGFSTSSKTYILEDVGEIHFCVGVLLNRIGKEFLLILKTSDHSAKPGIDYIIDPLNDCLNGSLDNSTFLLGYFSHTRQRCCLNITIVDNDYQEELLIEFNATLSLPDASGLLSVDVSPAVTTVVIIDDDQCEIETTVMEGALICYTQSNNCSGSCVILSSDQECCDKNATSIYVLGNDTCLDSINLCASRMSSPFPSQTPTISSSVTDSSSNSDQSTVITASVMATIGFILLVLIIAVTVVCLRRALKTDKFEIPVSTNYNLNRLEGSQSLASAKLMESLPRNLIISVGQLHLKDMLGQGEFGIVYKAFFKRYINSETELVAVKTLKGLFTARDVHGLAEEVLKMQAFHHNHVMSLIGVCLDSGAGPAVVMPYMANGSLLDYLRKERASLLLHDDATATKVSSAQKLLLNICLQIAEGMEYLTQEKVIHRDLAARNCMINSEGIIKVADFGLSVDIHSTSYYRQGKEEEETKLPIRWMALESILDGIYTEKTDVWSFGVTVWEVYSGGKLPYPGVDSAAILRQVVSGERLSKPENSACSEEIYSCMQQCWLKDAVRRPHFRDLVATISNSLESISGYLDLHRSTSIIRRVKKDYSHSSHSKKTEIPFLENGEQLKEGEAVQQDPKWGKEESKTIKGGDMESAGYHSQKTAV